MKILLQARTNSTRLPGKMLRPFYQQNSLLSYLLTRLSRYDVIVCTGDKTQDDALASLASNYFPVFRGSEENVRQRFIDCCKEYKIDRFIRVCGDNPFINLNQLRFLSTLKTYSNYDYIYYQVNTIQDGHLPSIYTHCGHFAELVKVSALTGDEHPTEGLSKRRCLPIQAYALNWLRLTIDTLGDFQDCQKIAEKVGYEAKYEDILSAIDDKMKARMVRRISANPK